MHRQQVADCLRYFEQKLGLTKSECDYRHTVGLLHDVDRDVIGKNSDLHLGDKLEEMLKELFDEGRANLLDLPNDDANGNATSNGTVKNRTLQEWKQ